jgi:hypothetical protein
MLLQGILNLKTGKIENEKCLPQEDPANDGPWLERPLSLGSPLRSARGRTIANNLTPIYIGKYPILG